MGIQKNQQTNQNIVLTLFMLELYLPRFSSMIHSDVGPSWQKRKKNPENHASRFGNKSTNKHMRSWKLVGLIRCQAE